MDYINLIKYLESFLNFHTEYLFTITTVKTKIEMEQNFIHFSLQEIISNDDFVVYGNEKGCFIKFIDFEDYFEGSFKSKDLQTHQKQSFRFIIEEYVNSQTYLNKKIKIVKLLHDFNKAELTFFEKIEIKDTYGIYADGDYYVLSVNDLEIFEIELSSLYNDNRVIDTISIGGVKWGI